MKRGNLNVFFILFLGAALISGGVNKAKAEAEAGGISIDLKSADIKVRIESEREEFKKPYKSKAGLLAFQAEIHYKEGLSLQGSGDLGEAKVCYHKVILLDSQYAPAYNQLGIISVQEGLSEESEAYYLKAVEADPKFGPAYSNLALSAEADGNFEKAIKYWTKRSKLGRKKESWVKLAKKRLKEINARR